MYEYKVVAWDEYMGMSFQDFLNKYAEDGWEFVSKSGIEVVFRREKDNV